MGGILQRVRLWWDTADKSQRLLSVGGIGFLVVLLVGVFIFASKPHMDLLFGGLSPSEQGSVVTELEKMGIQADFDERGDVLVPSDKVADARMRLASENKLPSTAGFGDGDLAKIGIMNTPSVEKERLKTILEGKLNEAIERIDGIENANVQIVLGDDSPFVRDEKPATASVTISERPGTEITKEQGRTIALLIANSVPGLKLDSVAVVDSAMHLLFDGAQQGGASGLVDNKLSTEESESRRRERDLQEMLDEVYGPQTTIAKVNVELDFDKRNWTEETNVPSDKLTTAKTTETMSNPAGGGAVGPAGAVANTNGQAGTPSTGPGSSGSGGQYQMTQQQIDYFKNTKTTEVHEAGGALKSMTVDVIANKDKVTDPTQLQSIVDGYMGAHANQPGFTDKVTLVKFDTSVAAAANQASKSAATQQRIQQVISMLPIAAMLFIGFLVMKQIGKMSKAPMMLAMTDAQQLALQPGGGGVRSGGVSGLPVAYGSNPAEQIQSIIAAQDDGNDEQNQIAGIKAIGAKINVPLEQIKKMGDQRPDAVAMLIKGWLMDDRR